APQRDRGCGCRDRSDEPDRIPRARTRDEYTLPFTDDIEKIYVAELTTDEHHNLTNLHPHQPDLPEPRKAKVKGRPTNSNDDEAAAEKTETSRPANTSDGGRGSSGEKITSLPKLIRADHNVGTRIGSEFLNSIGIAISTSALEMWMMKEGGPGLAGAVAALVNVPYFLGAPLFGYMTDHYAPKVLMRNSAFVGAVAAATSTVTLGSGTSYAVPIIIGTTFVGAGASALYQNSSSKVLTTMVGDAQEGLTRFSALTQSATRLVGGGLGGVLATTPWSAPLINLVTSAVNLSSMSGIPDLPVAEQAEGLRQRLRDAMLVGPRAIRDHSMIRSVNNGFILSNLVLGVQGIQFTALLVNSDISASQTGLLLAAVPTGAALGALVPTSWTKKARIKSLLTLRLAGLAGAAIAVAGTTDPWIGSAAFAAGWAGLNAAGNPATTYARRRTPEEVRGQVNAFRTMTTRAAFAVGGLTGGGAIALWGQDSAATGLAAGFGAVAAWSVLQRLFGHDKARTVLDCINQTSEAAKALGLLHGTALKRGHNNPEHLSNAIATQLIELPFGDDPKAAVSAYLDKIADTKNPTDTTIFLYDYGKKKGMHSTLATNIGNNAVLIFDTNIT
ncbi:MFS transporter, partial [Nocardia cyriacigeorgica]